MKAIVEAPAKVNLFLQVGPAREDGYHPVRTVMQCIEWLDFVQLELGEGSGSFQVRPDGMEARLPGPEGNLAWRSWEAFSREAGLRGRGLDLKLTKLIPLSAGLGGGSADAAAVLAGLDHLLGHPLEEERLSDLAARLGSDVPFFLTGGTALAEGRGEVITPLVHAPTMHLVLANPGLPLSTASVYRRFDASGPARFEREGLDGFLQALRSGSPREIIGALRNDLEASCCDLVPEAARLLEEARSVMSGLEIPSGEGAAMVSGSGPTVFALLAEEEAAASVADAMAGRATVVRRARFRPRGCRVLSV
jgi:4-diphosphocytidyl-2-C-methyl-D-erythritol kinase